MTQGGNAERLKQRQVPLSRPSASKGRSLHGKERRLRPGSGIPEREEEEAYTFELLPCPCWIDECHPGFHPAREQLFHPEFPERKGKQSNTVFITDMRDYFAPPTHTHTHTHTQDVPGQGVNRLPFGNLPSFPPGKGRKVILWKPYVWRGLTGGNPETWSSARMGCSAETCQRSRGVGGPGSEGRPMSLPAAGCSSGSEQPLCGHPCWTPVIPPAPNPAPKAPGLPLASSWAGTDAAAGRLTCAFSLFVRSRTTW